MHRSLAALLLWTCLLSPFVAIGGSADHCPASAEPTPAQERRMESWLNLIKALGEDAAMLLRRVDKDLADEATFATMCADLGKSNPRACEKDMINRTMGVWLGHGMLALMDQPRAQQWVAEAATRPDMQLMAHALQVLSNRLTLDQLLRQAAALSPADRNAALRIANTLGVSPMNLPVIDWALRDPEPKVRARALVLAADLGLANPQAEWALVRECGYSGCADILLRQTGPWEMLRSDWALLTPEEQDQGMQWVQWTPEARQWALAASGDWSPWRVRILAKLWQDAHPDDARQLSLAWLATLVVKDASNLPALDEDHPERQALASLLEILDLSDPPQRELLLRLAAHPVREIAMLAAVQFGVQGDTAQALRSLQVHLAPDGSLPAWAIQMFDSEVLMVFGDALWRTAEFSRDPESVCRVLRDHSDFLVSTDAERMRRLLDTSIATLLRGPVLDWPTVDLVTEVALNRIAPVAGGPATDPTLCRYYYSMYALRQVAASDDKGPADQIVGHDSPIAHWMLAQALTWYPDERLRPTITAFRRSGVANFVEWAILFEQALDQASDVDAD
jgi:hypothetical protein